MPRGGRRRRRRGPSTGEGKPKQVEGAENGQRRRRRRPQSGGIDAAQAIAAMSIPRPAQAQTLPADGTVLEELIGSLKEEYGTPATPQEYRLFIKVATQEEAPVVERSARQVPREPGQGKPRRRNRRRGKRSRPAAVEGAPDEVK
ncbi:MAG: hypothetical protein ABIS18_05540 [Actinomycetota bacterium]